MKRLLALVVIFALAFGGFAALPRPVAAADAPSGTFLGTWPYALPPNHHLSSFAAGGLGDNLGVIYRQMVQMPFAFYMWAQDKYEPLLAESFGYNSDMTAYDVKLRADAKWSNGDAVTADDVIATYALGRIRGWAQFT